jgi:hypothetical protein
MARGNSRAQSEARSPDVLAVRGEMKRGGVSAPEAFEKDPTLRGVFTKEKWEKALSKSVESMIYDQMEWHAQDEDFSRKTQLQGPPQYLKIGNKVYEATTDWDSLQEITFSGGWTSRDEFEPEDVEGPTAQDVIDATTIRLVPPDEVRRLSAGGPDRSYRPNAELPFDDFDAVRTLVPYTRTKEYQQLTAYGNTDKFRENGGKGEIQPIKVVESKQTTTNNPGRVEEPYWEISDEWDMHRGKPSLYGSKEVAQRYVDRWNETIKKVNEIRKKHGDA